MELPSPFLARDLSVGVASIALRGVAKVVPADFWLLIVSSCWSCSLHLSSKGMGSPLVALSVSSWACVFVGSSCSVSQVAFVYLQDSYFLAFSCYSTALRLLRRQRNTHVTRMKRVRMGMTMTAKTVSDSSERSLSFRGGRFCASVESMLNVSVCSLPISSNKIY